MTAAEGNEAGLAWEKMVHVEVGSEHRKRFREALSAYCKLDTPAIVRLLGMLQEHSG